MYLFGPQKDDVPNNHHDSRLVQRSRHLQALLATRRLTADPDELPVRHAALAGRPQPLPCRRHLRRPHHLPYLLRRHPLLVEADPVRAQPADPLGESTVAPDGHLGAVRRQRRLEEGGSANEGLDGSGRGRGDWAAKGGE